MRSNESRQDHAASRIDDFRVTRHLLFDYVRWTRGDDRAITHQHSAISYDGQVTELGANAWSFRPRERDDLRSVENRECFHGYR